MLTTTPFKGQATCSKISKINKVKYYPSKQQLNSIIAGKDRKIKSLKQKIRRKVNTIKSLNTVIAELKKKKLVRKVAADQLEDAFSGISLGIIVNHFKNQDKYPRGYRYSEEVKKITLTLHYYSPKS